MRCSHGPHNGLVSQIARLIDSTLLAITHRGYSSKPAGRGLASGLCRKGRLAGARLQLRWQ